MTSGGAVSVTMSWMGLARIGSETPSMAATRGAQPPAALSTRPARMVPRVVRSTKAEPARSMASTSVSRRRRAPAASAASSTAGPAVSGLILPSSAQYAAPTSRSESWGARARSSSRPMTSTGVPKRASSAVLSASFAICSSVSATMSPPVRTISRSAPRVSATSGQRRADSR